MDGVQGLFALTPELLMSLSCIMLVFRYLAPVPVLPSTEAV